MGHNNITSETLANRFKKFILNPPDNYKIEYGTTYSSPLNFPSTGIGGRGELLIYKDNSLINKLQVTESKDPLFENLDKSISAMDITKTLMGNVAMLWGLGFPESSKLNDGTQNLYYWGPIKLIEYGIVECL